MFGELFTHLYAYIAQTKKPRTKIALNSCQESWFDAASVDGLPGLKGHAPNQDSLS